MNVRLLLDLRVPGTPRPKGSLRFVTRQHAVEQVEGSPEWRAAVVTAARRAISCDCPDNCQALNPGYPHEGPVKVIIALEFTPPKKRQPLPANRGTGDIDKCARNILDALQDAGVVRDDAQVVDLLVTKRYTADGGAGARILVWTVAVVEESPAGRRDVGVTTS